MWWIWVLLIGWFVFEWTKTDMRIKEGDKYRAEAAERMKDELRSKGYTENKVKNLEYYSATNLLRKHDEQEKQRIFKENLERKTEQMEKDKKRKERYERELKQAEKEKKRIAKAYKNRPTIEEFSKDEYSNVSKDDKDYLDVRIFGNGGEFRFIYIDEEEYEKWRAFIDEGEIPEDMEDYDFDEEFYASEILTHFGAIYTAEFGTKNHYIQFEMEEYIEDSKESFGNIIKSHLGLTGDEKGYIVSEYVHSKKHFLSGSTGLDKIIRGPLSQDKITFYETYFEINSRKFDYDEFGIGEYTDWWNTIYKRIVPVSELKDILISDLW